MSMTEQTEAPAKRRVVKRRKAVKPQPRARAAPPAAVAEPDDLDGLSAKDCCFACDPEKGCAITGDVCGHPYKGGLQSAHQSKPAVVARFNRARKKLAHLAVDKRPE